MGIPTLTVGTPSPAVEINYQSLDSLAVKSKLGLVGTIPQLVYYTTSAGTAVVANSATSVFPGASYVGSKDFPAGSLSDSRFVGSTGAGAFYRINMAYLFGTIDLNATSLWQIGWIPAGGSYAAIAATTAKKMGAATTATLNMHFYVQCRAYSATAGSLTGWGEFQLDTGTYTVFNAIPLTTLSTLDTTQAFTFDVRHTFGATDAANTLTLQSCTIEQLN